MTGLVADHDVRRLQPALIVSAYVVAVVATTAACGAVPGAPGSAEVASSSVTASPAPSGRLPLCNPAAADYQKASSASPSPCISIDPNLQMQQNLAYLQRRNPSPADAAALGPAAVALQRVFTGLRAREQYDVDSAQTAVSAEPTLSGVRVLLR